MADLQYPDQSFYPSCKVRLIIRFDEFARAETVSGKAPKKILTKLKGVKDPRSGLTAVADPLSPPGTNRYFLKPDDGGNDSPGGPQKQEASADDLTHAIGGIIPSRCEVGKNGIRTADTSSIEMRYLDLPLDPRIIRSCAIEVYMGSVTSDAFASGSLGGTAPTSANQGVGDPLNLVPDTYTDSNGVLRSNLRFQGWVDEWEIEYPGGDKEPTVRLKCRDNTQLMIDTDAPPSLVLGVDQPIDKAIAVYLSNFPAFAGLTVEYRPGGTDIPKLKGQLSKSAYNEKTGGPTPAKGGGTGGKLSAWDYLTDIVGLIGHTIRVEGTNIIIQQVRTIVGKSFTQRPDDPFQGRQIGDYRTPSRLMIYGRNLKTLKVARKYSKTAPKNIEVRSYSHKSKTTLIERFPTEHSPLITSANPGESHNEVAYQVVRISGIEDRGTLKLIAQSTFEMMGRNEISVNMSTNNISSFGGSNQMDPDILDMEAGDTVDVQVNREEDGYNSVSIIDNIFASQERAREFLQAVGYSKAFASAAAKATSDAGFQTRFKVRAANFTWEIDQGISIDINAVNYTEVKIDQKWDGQEPDAGTTKGTKQGQGR
jgi:hypothetical protein